MGYKSFEELEVYKAAREYRKKIYELIKNYPSKKNTIWLVKCDELLCH
jgi:hypothetical protein